MSVAVGPDEEEEDRVDVYLRQLFELRSENQRLRENKLQIEEKMRRLEQDYSALRVQLISGGQYCPPVSDHTVTRDISKAFPRPRALERFSMNTSGYTNPLNSSIPEPGRLESNISE